MKIVVRFALLIGLAFAAQSCDYGWDSPTFNILQIFQNSQSNATDYTAKIYISGVDYLGIPERDSLTRTGTTAPGDTSQIFLENLENLYSNPDTVLMDIELNDKAQFQRKFSRLFIREKNGKNTEIVETLRY